MANSEESSTEYHNNAAISLGIVLQCFLGSAIFTCGLLVLGGRGYNVTAEAVILDIQPKGKSFWVCSANVILPHEESRQVSIDLPCRSQEEALEKHTEICYKHDDPTEAVVKNYWSKDNRCSDLSYRSAKNLLLACYILIFAFIAILCGQCCIYCLCPPNGLENVPASDCIYCLCPPNGLENVPASDSDDQDIEMG